MSWSCIICIEALDNVKGLCCTPCGHIFHFTCLNKWISRESQTCPQCRSTVRTSSVLRLYPNVCFHPTTSSHATLESDLASAKILLESKDEELSTLKNKQEQLTFYASKAEFEVSTLHQKNLDLESKLSQLTLRVKNTKSLEEKIKQLEISCQHQLAELDLYQQVKTVISSRRDDVEGILKNECNNYDNAHLTIKKFATMISVLKRELDLVQTSKTKQFEQILTLKSKLKKATEKQTDRNESLSKLKPKQKVLNLVKEDDKFMSGNFEDSPLSANFPKLNKKIDVIVLENDTGSTSNFNILNNKDTHPLLSASSSEQKGISTKAMTSKGNNCEDSITKNGYDGFGGHKSVVGKTDIKSIRRVLVDKRVRKPVKKCLIQNSCVSKSLSFMKK